MHDISDLAYVKQYVFANGGVYRGQMLETKRCGFGIMKRPDGSVYEGYWVDDKAEGKGSFWHTNGDIYIG